MNPGDVMTESQPETRPETRPENSPETRPETSPETRHEDREDRRLELRTNLQEISRRVAVACTRADRDPAGIVVIVITKTYPASDVRLLHGLGVRDVGENRDQEAAAKAADCADLDLTWHFVGQLQRNKAASVARYCDVVHSVDRGRLVTALDAGAARAGRRLDALVQVDLTDPPAPGRGGAAPADVLELCAQVSAADHLELRGLMAVAPLGEDPTAAFVRLAGVRAQVLDRFPEADWLSAGMSGDLEAAVMAGATHLRVGSAVLGERAHVG